MSEVSASSRQQALWARIAAYLMIAITLLFLGNNYLVFWQGWPGPWAGLGWPAGELSPPTERRAWLQLGIYSLVLLATARLAVKSASRSLLDEARRFEALAAYLVRSAFWAVLLIGLADALISLLRVEQWLPGLVGEDMAVQLARPAYRGSHVHYPLLALALLIALKLRSVSFAWLSLLVVLAEFLVVITRFVFSYEQAFMGDLVRFWYAALFLFASADTLLHDGHVRVDVFYARFPPTRKAWTNLLGSLLLGLPLCWVILLLGMGGRGNSITGPLLSYEISQSGYGMYVKYLMAGFLVVFAVSMIVQFTAMALRSIAVLHEPALGVSGSSRDQRARAAD